jgi:hypothetical protein
MLWKLFNRKPKQSFDYNIESQNVVESIFKSKKLYKELIKICHPDKNPDKSQIANDLSQLLNENRYNYRNLIEIQKRINEEL